MSTKKITGHCLCNKVRITASMGELNAGSCHCESCRRWCSGPFFAIGCEDRVEIEGKEWIKTYDSSDWADRGFCSECGTNLFYRLKQQNHYMLAVGLFEDQSGFNLERQVFIDEKPAFYNFSEETKNMTGPEIFALFGSS